jgi:predicted RNase H-like nuclease (RuvC/YqgF family)
MRTLEELNNVRQSLERQIDNSRNTDESLIDELDAINYEIKYLTEKKQVEIYENGGKNNEV